MNSQIKFLRRVRIHGEECGAVARALHHKAKVSLPAVTEKVSLTTIERKTMSTRTKFKRIALALVAVVGFGVLGNAPASNAAVFAETITIDAATDTAFLNETATAVLTHLWSSSQTAGNTDSTTIKSTCTAPSGGTCPSVFFSQTAASDTFGVQVVGTYPSYIDGLWTDTASAASSSVRSTVNVKAVNFGIAGTYNFTFYTLGAGGTALSDKSVSWTVTVGTRDLTTASARKYVSTDNYTAEQGRTRFHSSTDSAIVVDKGTAATPVAVGVAYFAVFNAAGESATANAAGGANRSTSTRLEDTLTVTVSGPGLVTGISTTKAKSATVNAYNSSTLRQTNANASTESITIWSDGTAGTGTITVSKGSVTLSTITVVFTGDPASAAIALSDTIVSLAAGTTVVGTVKDSGGNVMKAGTVYIFSSDTKVAGTNLSTNVFPTVATAYTIPSTGVLAYTLTTRDTGTATITLRDSWTVAASTWTSNEVVVDVRGSTIVKLTVAFDKATYSPGERAVITYTATDAAGKAVATAALTGLTPLSNQTMTDVTTASITGTNSGASGYGVLGTGFSGYMDTGIETRVVTMPTFGGKVTLTNTFATFGSTTGEKTTVTAEATVVDPNSTAIAGSTAAAEAATDAAAEAIDAANAATDAANLAAEAADAATVAADEARDAADAATAAVEELATQVATLMAALKAQITTLANTVAKIAKKVKA